MDFKSFSFYLIICICVLIPGQCSGSKILMLFPTYSPSHLVITEAWTKELANRGHEITVFSIFPTKDMGKGHRYFLTKIDDSLMGDIENMMTGMINNSGSIMVPFIALTRATRVLTGPATVLLEDPQLKKLMNEETFDLVVIDFATNEFLLGIAEYFKCPAIMISGAALYTSTLDAFGNPINFVADRHFFMEGSGNLNFIQRLLNFLLHLVDKIMKNYFDYHQRVIYEKYFPNVPFSEARKRLSLLLVNQHFSQKSPRPLVPAIIEVGGFQIPENSTLPENIQKWMDEAEHGVILFNFGSNAKSKFLPKEKLDIIIKTLSKLKQRIIFKWESDDFPDKPENMLIGKWLPQNDILAHPNLKLFVSHCGLASVIEAKYHAVPVVAIPIFGDQMGNADLIVQEGWAVKIDLSAITEENFSSAISEVLQNSTYRDTVKRLSTLYHDRPISPLDSAVYWTEYILRHKGASHIRYPAADLNFFQRTSLDVISFVLVLLYIFLKLTKFIFKYLRLKTLVYLRKFSSKKTK